MSHLKIKRWVKASSLIRFITWPGKYWPTERHVSHVNIVEPPNKGPVETRRVKHLIV